MADENHGDWQFIEATEDTVEIIGSEADKAAEAAAMMQYGATRLVCRCSGLTSADFPLMIRYASTFNTTHVDTHNGVTFNHPIRVMAITVKIGTNAPIAVQLGSKDHAITLPGGKATARVVGASKGDTVIIDDVLMFR